MQKDVLEQENAYLHDELSRLQALWNAEPEPYAVQAPVQHAEPRVSFPDTMPTLPNLMANFVHQIESITTPWSAHPAGSAVSGRMATDGGQDRGASVQAALRESTASGRMATGVPSFPPVPPLPM